MHVITRFSFIYYLLIYITYKVYQMERSVAKSLSSLSLALKEKLSATTGILSMDMFSILKNTSMEERHTTTVFVLRDRLVVSQKLTTMVDQKRSSNCNIIASRIKCFLFKCYQYDTTDRGIRVDPHHGLVEINSKARLRNINDVFVFAKQ